MIWYLVLIPLFIYVGLVLWFVKGWVGIKELGIRNQESGIMVSVIIPCRNEAENIETILRAIDQQNFDFKKLEVIVVDDHSTDTTSEEISNFKFLFSNFNPIDISLSENEHGKKAAIKKAIEISKGEIIVCTDADCEFEKNWLVSMTSVFYSEKIKMATGPVMFHEQKGFWNQLMQLEFLSLIGIGAASVQNGFPNMCNGANIAYRKSAFYEVNGFDGNEHIPSGDDEFLMHKIYKKFIGGIQFVKNQEAIVYTQSPQSFNNFVNQRIRWGSKTGHYKNIKSKLLPAFMYLFNLVLFFTPLFYFIGMPWTLIAALWLGKLSIEIVFFASILPFFRSSKILDLVIPAQVFHVMYITLIGVLSVFASYKWKGRRTYEKEIPRISE
ncbi:MAG: glycosyltransferase [Bacteroidia bacterium]